MRFVAPLISLLIAALYVFSSLQNQDFEEGPTAGLAIGLVAAVMISVVNFLWVHFILLAVSNISEKAGRWLRRFYVAMYIVYCGLAVGAFVMMSLEMSWRTVAMFLQFAGLALGLYAAFHCKIPWSEQQVAKIRKLFFKSQP